MTLRVIGAGLPRTGTTSLTAALGQLLGGSCYHMIELFGRAETDGPMWWQAIEGDLDHLDMVLAEYVAAVDWPASLFWRELVERHPEAIVVLSHRASPQAWWRSVDRTVWEGMRRETGMPEWDAFTVKMRAKAGLGDDWDDPAVAMAHYEALLAEVRESVPAERLVVWQPGDGWEPLTAALGVATPDEPFPHLNDTAEFRRQSGWD